MLPAPLTSCIQGPSGPCHTLSRVISLPPPAITMHYDAACSQHWLTSGPLLLLFTQSEVLSLSQRLPVLTSPNSYSGTQRLNADWHPPHSLLSATTVHSIKNYLHHPAGLQPGCGTHLTACSQTPHYILNCAVTRTESLSRLPHHTVLREGRAMRTPAC